MNTENLVLYKALPEWGNENLPELFKKQHNTKQGTWAKLTIFSGQLKFHELDEHGKTTNTFIFDKKSDIPFIEPQAWHKVEPLTDDLQCQLSFYCKPTAYYKKKYGLSETHSEVIEMIKIMQKDTLSIKELSALDLGCGGGRNSLYLQQKGMNVKALDKNPNAINKLNTIIEKEKIKQISAQIADLHQIDKLLTNNYDLAISTVVLMFLNKNKVPTIINAMQEHTKVGGYNLIVCAMDSNDYPYEKYDGQLPFSFGLKSGELKDYYKNWDIIKYNEDIGHLHRLDYQGNPIALRFATLIAKKTK